uniref:Uncharacterized protein n=1 Tax=Setaria italica TaxID=4555 RepID=K3Z1E2_SETIT
MRGRIFRWRILLRSSHSTRKLFSASCSSVSRILIATSILTWTNLPL